MFKDKFKELQTCKEYEGIISTELDGNESYSCPYEFLWVVDHIEKQSFGWSKEDINLLSDIGLPLTRLKSKLIY